MSNPYPIPRSIRETEWLVGDGRTVYGPFDFKIFDVEDVRVNLRRLSTGEPLVANFTVHKQSDVPLADFTIEFTSSIGSDLEYQVQGHRLHERTSDLFRGGSIRSNEVEKEVSKQAVVLQEVRRDVDEGKSQLDDIVGTITDLTVRAEDAAQTSEEAKAGAEVARDETRALLDGAQDALQKAETAVQPDRRINTGEGLEGGGDLSQDRTISLSEASIYALGKANSSVQSVNGVAPDESGNVAASTPVADGSVTDAKLPTYDPLSSPSAAKLRYRASVAAGVIAGSVFRSVESRLSEALTGRDFGVKADGTTDDTAAMVAAISAMETTGRPLFLPPGVIMVNPGALKFGDGGAHGVSTRHGQAMFGCGVDTAFNAQGTIIRARQAGGLLFETRAVSGARISGLTFDCANLCSDGLNIMSSIACSFVDFSVKNFLYTGLQLSCYDGPANAPMWTSNNRFENFYITSTQNREWSYGLVMTGVIGKNFDPHRNTFIGGVVQLPRVAAPGGAHGAWFKFCDSNTFIECDIGVYGSGNGAGVLFSSADNAGFPYPQNQFMYGCSLAGGVAVYEPNNTSIGPNFFVCHTTRDGEGLPNHPQIKGFSDDGFWFSNPEVRKNAAAVVLQGRNGPYRYRVMANVTDVDDFGFHIQQWISGETWQTLMSFKVGDNPKLFFPSVGLREIRVGDPDTGGSGFRRLVAVN